MQNCRQQSDGCDVRIIVKSTHLFMKEIIFMFMLSKQEMYEAVANKDCNYDEKFYYGVVTTGIYCKPSCASRSAKPENIRFFPTVASAMLADFRPCKRCSPHSENTGVTRLINVARHIEKNFDQSLTLKNLGKLAELSPSRLQRLFKQAFGVSPKAYQDGIRMQHFKTSLKQDDNITDAIFSSGFGSVSRVYGQAKRNIGMTPSAYRAGGYKESITYTNLNTTLGCMTVGATDKGICFVQFGASKEELLNMLEKEFPKADIHPSTTRDSHELDRWTIALDKYLSEGAPRPDLPLDMRGTAFQMKVWNLLLTIQEGEVLSYRQLATRIDQPKAARAVASACAKNRIGVLIPCHRIIRGDGTLGGHRWGMDRKQTLLNAEQKRASTVT